MLEANWKLLFGGFTNTYGCVRNGDYEEIL